MTQQLLYDKAPGFGPVYWQLLTTRRKGMRPGDALPELAAAWKGARFDPAALDAYCAVCRWPLRDAVPILYPHVLTSAMHIAMFSQPAFPLSLFGAVHARFHALQRQALLPGATVNVQCRLCDSRVVKQGLELDVSTVLLDGGDTVWESVSTYLVRGKNFGEPLEAPPLAAIDPLDPPEGALEEPWLQRSWPVPPGQGRRYAKVCGDYNPIHIGNLPAKLFGFPRAIIHGMWSAARCLSELPDLDGNEPQFCALLFKGPVFIGDESHMTARVADGHRRFDLFCADNPRPSVQGEWRAARPGESLIDG